MTRDRTTWNARPSRQAQTARGGPGWREAATVLAMLVGVSRFAWAQEVRLPAQPVGSDLPQKVQALEAENLALKRRLTQAAEMQERLTASGRDFAELASRLQAVEALAQTLKAERAASQRQLQDMSLQIQTLREERDALRAELAATTQQAASLRAQLAAARTEAQKGQVSLAEARRRAAQAASRGDVLEAELERMRGQLRATQRGPFGGRQPAAAAMKDSGEPGDKSAQSTQRLAGAAEGPLDVGQAKADAAKISKTYRQLVEEARGRPTPVQAAELELTRTRLAAAQSLVARLVGARGVHTVRPGDTLTAIAATFYGEGLRWQEILGANRYLLEDADHIVPGMVLVVP